MSEGITGTDVLFVLLGAILVFTMHAGFAFLEVGTVRRKNQVNALVKIIADFGMSTISYFFVGYAVAYGVDFLVSAAVLSGEADAEGYAFSSNGYDLVKFFFLLTFAAAIPAIISGGIAERAKFWPQLIATAIWAFRPISKKYSGSVFMTLPAQSSFMLLADGSPLAPSSISGRGRVAIQKTVA